MHNQGGIPVLLAYFSGFLLYELQFGWFVQFLEVGFSLMSMSATYLL